MTGLLDFAISPCDLEGFFYSKVTSILRFQVCSGWITSLTRLRDIDLGWNGGELRSICSRNICKKLHDQVNSIVFFLWILLRSLTSGMSLWCRKLSTTSAWKNRGRNKISKLSESQWSFPQSNPDKLPTFPPTLSGGVAWLQGRKGNCWYPARLNNLWKWLNILHGFHVENGWSSSFFIHFQPMNQTHFQNSCHFRNRASSEGVDRDNSSNSQIKTRQNRGQLGFVTISACYKNDSSAAEMMEDLYFKYKASKTGETCRNNSSKKDISHKRKSHPENIKKHQIFSEN